METKSTLDRLTSLGEEVIGKASQNPNVARVVGAATHGEPEAVGLGQVELHASGQSPGEGTAPAGLVHEPDRACGVVEVDLEPVGPAVEHRREVPQQPGRARTEDRQPELLDVGRSGIVAGVVDHRRLLHAGEGGRR